MQFLPLNFFLRWAVVVLQSSLRVGWGICPFLAKFVFCYIAFTAATQLQLPSCFFTYFGKFLGCPFRGNPDGLNLLWGHSLHLSQKWILVENQAGIDPPQISFQFILMAFETIIASVVILLYLSLIYPFILLYGALIFLFHAISFLRSLIIQFYIILFFSFNCANLDAFLNASIRHWHFVSVPLIQW